jgi:hypothetical protein
VLQKGIKYSNEFGHNIELVDYFYYEGSKEHSFQLNINGKFEKHIIENNKIDIFLNKFKTQKQMEQKPKKSIYREMQEILLESMKQVKSGSIDTQKAFAISKLGDSFVNSVKVEAFSRINKVYPDVIK